MGRYMMAAGGLLGMGAALISGSVLFGPVGLLLMALIISGAALVTLSVLISRTGWRVVFLAKKVIQQHDA